MPDPALVFLDGQLDPQAAGTHALVIGVSHYAYGKDGASGVTGTIIDDLKQLTSPAISARALTDWLIESFRPPTKPLASISLVISEEPSQIYLPKARLGTANTAPATGGASGTFAPPIADLAGVKAAAIEWALRLQANPDNMAVLYFCGHGVSSGQQAALLLRDFGKLGEEYDDAIDVNVLLGVMKNSPAIQQVFLVDCCRTKADDLYKNQSNIGSRILSLPAQNRGHTTPEQQFVLFPSLDGEEAFGIRNATSVFTRSIIDALSFAAADFGLGKWIVTTTALLTAVDRLVRSRVPPAYINRAKPNSPNATSFDLNEIDTIAKAKSIVSLSDPAYWGNLRIDCIEPVSGQIEESILTNPADIERCAKFEVIEGKWRFAGAFSAPPPPNIQPCERQVLRPVAYITLGVVP
jgi:hypothetical protein